MLRKIEKMTVEKTKFLYTKREAADSMGLCVRSIEHLMADGRLETRASGRRRLIPRESLRRYACTNHPERIRPLPPPKED